MPRIATGRNSAMINRPSYIRQMKAFQDKDLIKILTGVRRCGKSTLFALFRQELLRQGVRPEQILGINLEDVANEPLLDYHKLHDYITERMQPDARNYVFLDEIQNVPDFQRAVRSLMDRGNIDLYLTGSNSRLQSGEWATSIAGRYVEIHVLPLSLKEYADARPELRGNPDALYDAYLHDTAFPQATHFNTDRHEEETARYLEDLYHSIVIKDIAANKGIREIARLERVLGFMANAIGSEISVKKIADTMTSDGIRMAVNTVESYLQAFRDSYLLYKVDRYDVKGRKLLKTLNKYYLVDLGLRTLLMGQDREDTGHMLENLVYFELLRRGYRVTIGKLERWDAEARKMKAVEVDFVARKGKEISYYQVSESIIDPKTRERELASLQAIGDHYPKFILTRDYSTASYDGIRHMNVIRWLLAEE